MVERQDYGPTMYRVEVNGQIWRHSGQLLEAICKNTGVPPDNDFQTPAV